MSVDYEKKNRAQAERMLWDELIERCDMNAAAGYILWPDLPAPEVFERPDWSRRQVQGGKRKLEIWCEPGMPSVTSEPIPPREPETRIVRPMVEATWTDYNGETHWSGLGIDVENRWLVFFHSLLP